jgi:hypothetical protein
VAARQRAAAAPPPLRPLRAPAQDALARLDIVPSDTRRYKLSKVRRAIKRHLGVDALVHCNERGELSEVSGAAAPPPAPGALAREQGGGGGGGRGPPWRWELELLPGAAAGLC